ncbi:MAG TPA: hypothetical protein VHP34_11635 [Alphaproteobacteria bacterium]|nr:hypothetical protein [Alphaproteobacteria bacterium]
MNVPDSVRRVADSQMHLIRWLLTRVKLCEADQEQIVEMIMAALSESHSRGIDDSAEVVEAVAKAHPSRNLEIVGQALRTLAAKNRASEAV